MDLRGASQVSSEPRLEGAGRLRAQGGQLWRAPLADDFVQGLPREKDSSL